MKLKHILLFEDLVAMTDPQYGSSVFSIRFRSIDNLSNKKAPDSIDKPVNDVLDGIEPGDSVTGIGIKDEKEHTGNVIRVQKDERGENIKIEIEEDGETIELAPSTVKFAEQGDKGNKANVKGEPADTGIVNYGASDTFVPVSYESKIIKKFDSFLSESLTQQEERERVHSSVLALGDQFHIGGKVSYEGEEVEITHITNDSARISLKKKSEPHKVMVTVDKLKPLIKPSV